MARRKNAPKPEPERLPRILIEDPRLITNIKRISAVSRTEWREQYALFYNNLLSLQGRLIEFMGGRTATGARSTFIPGPTELREIGALIKKHNMVSDFISDHGLEPWPNHIRCTLRLMRESLEFKVFNKPPARESPFYGLIGKRVYFGEWKGSFEHAYLLADQTMNALISARYGKELAEAKEAREVKIDLGGIQEKAVGEAFGKEALHQFKEWMKETPKGNVFKFLFQLTVKKPK